MGHEVTKTASSHCEVIRVSTRRWLKDLRRRTVAWKNHLLAGQPCRPQRAIAKRPRVPPICCKGSMFFRHRCSLERGAKQNTKLALQHLKDPPLCQCSGLAPAKSVSRMPQSLVMQARCARPLSLHRTDVVRHLTLGDAPLCWVEAPYCPKSEVHGRSESFISHNFTKSQNVMLQVIV